MLEGSSATVITTAGGAFAIPEDLRETLVARLRRYCRAESATVTAFQRDVSRGVVLDAPGKLTVLAVIEHWLGEDGVADRFPHLVRLAAALREEVASDWT
jgi:hypothetical protein